ncbi:MAG: FAD binding domain-containing protein [Rhizobiaceae bacterium]|nr:FAD binding domain-containing protein [Rhizobiaceae bacterium]
MKPAPFDYVRAESLDEVLDVLAAEQGEARILAGGQSLLPMLSMRLARPRVVIDVGRIRGLDAVETAKDGLVATAGLRQATLLAHPGLERTHPLLAAALPWVGHVQTRARGTICGSVAHADPSAELPLCLVALGGSVRLISKRGRRRVEARDFFTGLMSTGRREDEMIEAVSFPEAKRETGYAFREFGRRHGDFAIASVAAVVTTKTIEISVGGVDDVPARRAWPRLEGSALDDALNALAWELDARDDIHADQRLRRDLVRSLGRIAITEASQCLV